MPDTLFLLTPGFPDEALPGRHFYCEHCALIEGVLTSFPDLGNDIEVRRVAFPRPRKDVVAPGGRRASIPAPAHSLRWWSCGRSCDTRTRERRFISNKDEILRALSLRHGFPEPHP